jgi:hypothetical protein
VQHTIKGTLTSTSTRLDGYATLFIYSNARFCIVSNDLAVCFIVGVTWCTTGICCFAECLEHSAKGFAECNTRQKALPSVTLGKERSVKILSAKGSLPSVIYRALGKGFADRNEKIIKK